MNDVYNVTGAAIREERAARRVSPFTQYFHLDRSFKVEIALYAFIFPVAATLWLFAGYYYYYSGHFSAELGKAAVYFTIASVFARIFYGNARVGMRGKSVVVDGDRVSKKSPGEISVFNCAEASGIRKPEFTFFGKQLVLESPEKKFTIPLNVRGGHEMVEKIFGIFEAHGFFFENLAKMKSEFCEAARRLNIRHELRARYTPGMFAAAAAAALLNGIAAMMYWERSLITALFWGFFNMHLQIGAYMVTEEFHAKKILRSPSHGGDLRQTGAETDEFTGYYVMAGLIALLLGMTAGIAFTEPG